jgi:hypothetical protein
MLAFYLVSYTSADFSDKLKSFCLLLLCIFECSTSHLLQHKELTEFGFCVRFLRQKYHPVMIWSYGLRWTQHLLSSQAQVCAIVSIHELRVLRNSSWYLIYPELRMQVAFHWEIVVFAFVGAQENIWRWEVYYEVQFVVSVGINLEKDKEIWFRLYREG